MQKEGEGKALQHGVEGRGKGRCRVHKRLNEGDTGGEGTKGYLGILDYQGRRWNFVFLGE